MAGMRSLCAAIEKERLFEQNRRQSRNQSVRNTEGSALVTGMWVGTVCEWRPDIKPLPSQIDLGDSDSGIVHVSLRIQTIV